MVSSSSKKCILIYIRTIINVNVRKHPIFFLVQKRKTKLNFSMSVNGYFRERAKRSDLLLERARWASVAHARSGFPALASQEKRFLDSLKDSDC